MNGRAKLCYNKRTMKRFFRIILPALAIILPLSASAITLLPPCTASGNCGITDIVAVLINVAEYLLGISGAVALGFFVYGGFVFVLSRGSKAEVDKAFGILRSATIGIAIIFLSGVLVRFTTQSLTGGVSAIPTVGETCNPKTNKSALTGDGLWVSIPAGRDSSGNLVPEGLVCVDKTDNCKSLNGVLNDRNRQDLAKYSCIDVSTAKSCVRGLCGGGASSACCLK